MDREPPALVAVKYVGKRERYVDGAFGSRIEFQQGQTLMVPADLAAKMLKHPDVYVPGATKGADVAVVDESKANQEPEEIQELRDQIANMDKAALKQFAKERFRMDIDGRKPLGDLRGQVTGLLDQYGV